MMMPFTLLGFCIILFSPSLSTPDFAADAESRLGRANGNTYQRKLGVDNVHDGQMIVRLKKKRFIVLDYGHVPSPQDYEIANQVSHISIPAGAGTKKCSTKDVQGWRAMFAL